MPTLSVEPGQRFGRWTVLQLERQPPTAAMPYGRRAALCRCACGTERLVALLNLGRSTSCGCYHREKVAADNRRLKPAQLTTHGQTASSTYWTWHSMIQRCENPNATGYKHYGGRGISICTRWHTFVNFLTDMGERPAGLTLDRINNDGSYEPGNCRWATRKEQRANSRRPTRRAGRANGSR